MHRWDGTINGVYIIEIQIRQKVNGANSNEDKRTFSFSVAQFEHPKDKVYTS